MGTGLTTSEPGSARGMCLVVTAIAAAREERAGRGVEVSDIRHMHEGSSQPGPDPRHLDYASFADITDPDGNTWVLQEVGHPASGD